MGMRRMPATPGLEEALRRWSRTPLPGRLPQSPPMPDVERVIVNGPTTVVLFADGTKSRVTCQAGDAYDAEKGVLLCIAKLSYGNTGAYNKQVDKAFALVPEKAASKKGAVAEPFFRDRHGKKIRVGDSVKGTWLPVAALVTAVAPDKGRSGRIKAEGISELRFIAPCHWERVEKRRRKKKFD